MTTISQVSNSKEQEQHQSIIGLISFQAQLFPNKKAIIHNNSFITYEDLHRRSNQIAAYFLDAGFGAGDIVAVAMHRSLEMSVCLLSLLKAGITYVPLDPNLPLERIDFLIDDSVAKFLITVEEYKNTLSHHPSILFADVWSKSSDFSTDEIEGHIDIDQLAYIIYTSGSTGKPKGVGITQRSLLNLLLFRHHTPGVDSSDNMIGITSMSFDISEEELYLPLTSGACLTIVDDDIAKDGEALLDTIRKERITIMQATPYVWQMMLEAGWDDVLPLKAFCGGEALTKKLSTQLLHRSKELWNMYGPTETTICSIVKKLSLDDDIITIGKPIANTQVYILDESMNEVLPGKIGEIYIGGAGVAPGYINRPELTAEKFISNPFGIKAGTLLYKTGDFGKRNLNGDYQFMGRIDTQMKIRGYRIETEEVEYHIKEHTDIKDAFVTVHVDTVDNLRLVTYFTLYDERKIAVLDEIKNELRERLKRLLPAYMVPVDYFAINHIPLLPSGKVDRKSLPHFQIQRKSQAYVAPTTEMEKILTDIWIETIGINQIGVNDNFFDLGGTSMIAVKTKIQIEKILHKRLRPSILFKYPTIQKLAEGIIDDTKETFKSLVSIKPHGDKIPLYIVHGIGLNVLNFRGLANALDADQPVYGIQAVDADDPIDPLFTVEEIAAFYNNEILTQNPDGPYIIAGYSIGGVIAFEMAKQLLRDGKDVKSVIMFDSSVQIPTHQFGIIKKLYVKSLRQVHKLRFRVGSFLQYPKSNIKYLLEMYRRKINMLFFNQIDTYGLPDYMAKTIIKITNAFYRYKIVPFDVKLILFRTKKFYYLDDPEYLGWKNFARKGIKVFDVSSGHNDMFEDRFVEEIADMLQAQLDELNCRNQ